mgnify:CR=1 FL=1
MELLAKTRKIGGSIAVIIPKEVVRNENLLANDTVKIKIEKTGDLSFMWGRFKDIKKSTTEIMHEIDEGELDG